MLCHRRLPLALSLLCLPLLFTVVATAQSTALTTGYEVRLEFQTPGVITKFNPPPYMPISGWPLTVKMTSDLHLTGRGIVSDKYPKEGRKGWFLYSDHDSCYSFTCKVNANGNVECGHRPCAPWTFEYYDSTSKLVPGKNQLPPADEVYLEFTPSVANRTSQVFPGKPLEIASASTLPEPVGSGVNPAVPSLIVIADKGAGLIADKGPGFNVIGRRNLAKYFNAVSYSLAENCPIWLGDCKSSVTAQMVVPDKLFLPQVLLDQAYGNDGCFTNQVSAWMEPGKPLTTLTGFGFNSGWYSPPVSSRVKIEAVVVNGKAADSYDYVPSRDGSFAEYLRRRNIPVISNVETIFVDLYYEVSEKLDVYFYNFGGNAAFRCGLVAPAAPLDREDPPR